MGTAGRLQPRGTPTRSTPRTRAGAPSAAASRRSFGFILFTRTRGMRGGLSSPPARPSPGGVGPGGGVVGPGAGVRAVSPRRRRRRPSGLALRVQEPLRPGRRARVRNRQSDPRRVGVPRPRRGDRRRRLRPLLPCIPGYFAAMIVLKALFWGSLGALAWTHAGYPAATAVAARLRPKRVRKDQITPTVTMIVPAYNEEAVIRRRLENLLELDYPDGRLEIVVTSDASDDRTDEIVAGIAESEPRISLRRRERAGKLPGLNRTVAESEREIVAFTDANTTWAPDALTKLVRNFADDDTAYVCGRLTLLSPDGANREGIYWRYELLLRDSESRLGSITGGNGSIYAIRRSDYAEAPFGHDLSFPV